MSKVKRVLGLAGIVVLAMAMLFGCARVFWNLGEPSGRYIRLNIGNPAAKAIGVEEYDVTEVYVELFEEGGTVPFYTVSWYAGGEVLSELIPVSGAGEYRIEVTHISENGGDPVEAMESADFTIQSMVITVIEVIPGCIGMMVVDGGEPPEPVDLTGFWDAILTPTGGESNPPHLLYIKQIGTFLNANENVTGSVNGQTVTMVVDEGSATFTGTIKPDGTFGGPFDWMGETGTFEMVPSNLLFGSFDLGGLINLSTALGLGFPGEEKIIYRLDFHVRAGTLEGSLAFENQTGLAPGTYSVIPREGYPDPGPTEVNGWLFEDWLEEYAVQAGTLTLTRYDATGVSGSFALEFEEDNSLSGLFELNQPMYSGGTVTITGGYWKGLSVPDESAGGLIWNTGAENDWGEWTVNFIDEDRGVTLNFSPWSRPVSAGEYMVPNEMSVRVEDHHDEESEYQYEGEAESGTLVITSFQEYVGMAGYFDNMVFPEGTLSGSFEVSFQLTEYE